MEPDENKNRSLERVMQSMNKRYQIPFLLMALLSLVICQNQILAQNLKVSDNNRFLVQEDGTPFFWLGDTAWQLLNVLDKKESEHYLRNRASKGFNVVQCVLPGLMGLNEANHEGERIFENLDPTKTNEKYFEHIDWVLDKADALGVNLALLPLWGRQIQEEHPTIKNKKIFNVKSAFTYGAFLGKRYKNKTNIVWVLGGDATPEGYEQEWQSLAKGIKAGGSEHLMTYHNYGEKSSSEYWHTADWLDFNMIQSGHQRAFYDNYRMIKDDYGRSPAKPVLEGEPIYEGIYIGFATQNGRAKDHHVRVVAYWSIFSGAFGFTYGHNSIWQMYDTDREPMFGVGLTWKEAMDTPGSYQMRYLKNLMLSRPFLSRIPDQSLAEPEVSHGVDHLQITRDGTLGKKDATYIMVYFPFMTHKYKIKTDVITSSKLCVWWYDPRTGTSFPPTEIDNSGVFQIPWGSNVNTDNSGPDWVLVIDDSSKNYSPPLKPPSFIKKE